MALGIDDTTVTTFATTAIGSGIPMIVVPAMHASMFNHPEVMNNVKKLEKMGVKVVGPRIQKNVARIAEVDEIVDEVLRTLSTARLKGKSVLVVTGATQEPIDDMRVISNRSSGAMGLAIAKEAYELGAELNVWHGPGIAVPEQWNPKSFTSASDLLAMVKKLRKVDVALIPAAISDFAPKREAGKISSGKAIKLDLKPTPKIIHGLRSKAKILVGFKAESGVSRKKLVDRATARMRKTRAEIFVANDLRKVKHEETEIVIIGKDGVLSEVQGSKTVAAREIMKQVEYLF
jgi:phosphopantothenoylcysteine decarboxylase/phosphopantothenate--cysteine ligase